jgi:hypothetical protein
MSDGTYPTRRAGPYDQGRSGSMPARGAPYPSEGPVNLADLLERILDKGIVIAGDIKINLVDVELLTIKLRLLVASVDRAKEMGIDWWEHDPSLSSKAADRRLAEENAQLRRQLEAPAAESAAAVESADPRLVDENRRLRRMLAEAEGGAEQEEDES